MLSDKELDHIASLARIKIGDNERERLKKDLSSVLDYVAKLSAANTSDVEPLYQTTGLINSTRADEPRNEFPMNDKLAELLIGQAPHKKDRFVKVHSILDKK
jgi:aspartyl-tRNA(Asn)/glutamyl-tRNA(Gln) amidotransferase subunit C